MRLKIILFTIIAGALMSACTKDFDLLKHPIVVEGDMDPVWAIPAAKWSVSVNDLMSWIDTIGLFSIYTNEDDILSMRYQDTLHSVYNYDDVKALPAKSEKEEYDSMYLSYKISGRLDMPLFSSLDGLSDNNLQLKGLYVSASAFVKGFVNDTARFNYNHGIRMFLDSVYVTVVCADGFSPVIPLADEAPSILERELIAGKKIDILNQFDISPITNRKPKYIRYSMNLITAVPTSRILEGSVENYLKSIGFDSIVADTRCIADFPLQIHCNDISHGDTLEWQLPADISDSVLNQVEQYLTLDSTSYLVIEARNHIPLSFNLNLSLMDSNMAPLADNILNGEQVIQGAKLRLSEIIDSYVADDYSRTCISIPIDSELLHDLKNTRFLGYRIGLSTSTAGATGEMPTVAVLGKDKIDFRIRVVLAPHVHFSSEPIDVTNF